MRHEYKGGKTLCGENWYRTGFSPCELADRELPLRWDTPCSMSVLQGDGTFAPCGQARESIAHSGHYSHPWKGYRLSAADMAAVAEVTGADQCDYIALHERMSGRTHGEIMLVGDVIDTPTGKVRVLTVSDDGTMYTGAYL